MKSEISNHFYFQVKLDSETMDALRNYMISSEREYPLVFEGRHEIRNYVKDKIAHLRRADRSLSSTIVIQGAPGVGKTSLLEKIAEERAKDKNLVVVSLPTDAFDDPAAVLQGFISHEGTNFEELSRAYGRQGSATLDAKIFKAGGVLSSQLPSLATIVKESPTSVWGLVKESLNTGEDPIFLLLVDEAQRIRPDGDGSGKNTFISALHDGKHLAGLKILPVFVGLSDTDDALSNAGITREAQDGFTLGPLASKECVQVVLATMDALGLTDLFDQVDRVSLGRQIDLAGDGWPRHIHNYLQALVAEIEVCQQEGETYIDFDKVLDEGHDNRIRYYFKRLNRITGYDDLHSYLDSLAMKFEIDEEMKKGDVFDHFQSATGVDRDVANGMIDACVHNGIFQKFQNGNYGFSIPSLHTFLANGRDVEVTKDLLRSRVAEETA